MLSLASIFGHSTLTLKEFSICENGNSGQYVHIKARKSGFISFILSLMHIDSTTEFDVYNNKIEMTSGSLSGEIKTIMPVKSISVATCGFCKPIFAFILAIAGILGFFGLIISQTIIAIIALIVGIICGLYYFMRKSLLVSVVANSGWSMDVCFKNATIDGKDVDYEQTKNIVGIINGLLTESQSAEK